jgi:hypothetical protein
MTIALVSDRVSESCRKLLDKLTDLCEVYLFLPDACMDNVDGITIRKFESDFQEAMFQRYDILIYFSEANWDVIMPVMKEVYGIAIIDTFSPLCSHISACTAFQHPLEKVDANLINSLPKHIHCKRTTLARLEKHLEN